MSKWDKLIARIKSLSKDLRYEELKKILEAYGYEARETSGGSSHITFRKKGRTPITLPRSTPMKRIYVELVRDIVEKEERNEEC